MEFSSEYLTLFTVIGFLSGLINAVAGGGGMLVLPVLLWAGVPPINALAVNKFQAVFGTLSSSFNFYRNGLIDLKPMLPALGFAVIGSALGTGLLQIISGKFLAQLLPWLLIGAALYTAFSPRISDEGSNPLCSQKVFNFTGGFGIGFYGGFFGPGMGTLAALFFAVLLGYNMRRATAHAKPVVVVSNIISMLIFVFAGQVLWAAAVPMALAQIVGGRIGSNLVISRGVMLIKPLIVTVTIIIAVRLLI